MSLQRFIFTAVLAISSLATVPATYAQHAGFLGKSDDNSDFTGLYDPFCDLDANWFEPIYCDDAERPMNSGWFFGYRRMRTSVSRPQNEAGVDFYDPLDGDPNRPDDELLRSVFVGDVSDDLKGDWAWGNRFDFGWMSEEGTGIWFVARKLDSPNERVSFDNIDLNDLDTLRLDNQPWGPSFATINGLRMYGFEANKVWRLEPTPRGAVIEPFVGPRYMRLRDHADRNDVFSDAYSRLKFPLTGIAGTGEIRQINFDYRYTTMTTDNDLFGGQFGMRSRWRRGRWQVTSDVRGLMFWNHQVKERLTQDERQSQDWSVTWSGVAVGTGGASAIGTLAPSSGVVLIDTRQQYESDTSNTFAYGGELNLELSFDITQGFALTAGAEVIALGDGIGRGFDSVDDSLLMSGFSFGLTFNR